MMKSKIIVIVGPTGTGKTKLSIELAHYYDAEIIIMVHTREGKGCEDITLIAQ